MLSDVGGGGRGGGGLGLASVLDKESFFFSIKENWICTLTRHHAAPNNILLRRNLSFDSDFRQ